MDRALEFRPKENAARSVAAAVMWEWPPALWQGLELRAKFNSLNVLAITGSPH